MSREGGAADIILLSKSVDQVVDVQRRGRVADIILLSKSVDQVVDVLGYHDHSLPIHALGVLDSEVFSTIDFLQLVYAFFNCLHQTTLKHNGWIFTVEVSHHSHQFGWRNFVLFHNFYLR